MFVLPQAVDALNSSIVLSKLEDSQEYYIERLQKAVKAAREFINTGGDDNYLKWRQALRALEE